MVWMMGVAIALASQPAKAPPPLRLTTDGLFKRDPTYVEGGRAIVYAARHPSPRMVLMKLDRKTKTARRLYPQSSLVEFCPSFSKNENRLIFLRMTGNDQITLMMHDLSGEEAASPPRGVKTSRKVPYNAVISPDGRYAAYNLSGQIYRLDLASGKEQQLTKSAGRNDWPRFSPGGHQIAFASSRNGDYDLYIMDLPSGPIRRLTTSRGLDMRPCWSPDGRRLAFTSNRDGNYEIYSLSTGGGGLRRHTRHPERDDNPAWRPDGKRILAVSEREGQSDLWEYASSGSALPDQ